MLKTVQASAKEEDTKAIARNVFKGSAKWLSFLITPDGTLKLLYF